MPGGYLSARGVCLQGGYLSARGVSACKGVSACPGGGCLYTSPSCTQTDTCENITFSQLLLWTVKCKCVVTFYCCPVNVFVLCISVYVYAILFGSLGLTRNTFTLSTTIVIKVVVFFLIRNDY